MHIIENTPLRARLPQRPRQPPIPPIPHTEDTLLAIVVSVLTGRIAQYRGEEPEARSRPGGNGDADGDEGREEVDNDQHGRAVVGRGGEGVDEVELEVERGREEGGELGREGRARGEEAEGLEEERDEEGDHGPEHDEEGEEGAWQREIELERWLANWSVFAVEVGCLPATARACLRGPFRRTRRGRRRWSGGSHLGWRLKRGWARASGAPNCLPSRGRYRLVVAARLR